MRAFLEIILVSAAVTACTALKDDADAGATGPWKDAAPETSNAAHDAGADSEAGAESDAGDADADADASRDSAIAACPACASRTACNPQSGTCEPCKLADDATDFYVDAASNELAGSATCPAKTITRALDLVNLSTATGSKTIHVAAGIYDMGLGEIFPLRVPGMVSIVGAGSSKTLVKGSGIRDVSGTGVFATISAGTFGAGTSIDGVSLVPLSFADASLERVGILVTEGDVEVHHVSVGPGYTIGVKLDDNTATKSGSITVTSSVFDESDSPSWFSSGVFAAGRGCGSPWGDPSTHSQALRPISVTVGDGTADGGNVFIHGTRAVTSTQVWITGCVAKAKVVGNTFLDSPEAVQITVGDAVGAVPADLVVTDNVIDGALVGVDVLSASKATLTFTNNTLRNIHAAAGSKEPGIALSITSVPDRPNLASMPAVARASGNTFVGNDVGVKIAGPLGHASRFDFRGENNFRCNAGSASASFEGGDVWIASTDQGGGSVDLRDDLWDHASPKLTAATTFANGADIILSGTPAPAVVTSGAAASSEECPVDSSP